jgi:hypothetical protein
MPGIRLSPTYGVNPSIDVCFFCGQDSGALVLPGQLRGDSKAPYRAVWNREPCDTCRDWMRQGVICISARADSDPENPYRTGGWVVMNEKWVRRVFNAETVADLLKSRVCFLDDVTWDALGLPRGAETK